MMSIFCQTIAVIILQSKAALWNEIEYPGEHQADHDKL